MNLNKGIMERIMICFGRKIKKSLFILKEIFYFFYFLSETSNLIEGPIALQM